MNDDGIDFQPSGGGDGIDFQPLNTSPSAAPSKTAGTPYDTPDDGLNLSDIKPFAKNVVSDVAGQVKGIPSVIAAGVPPTAGAMEAMGLIPKGSDSQTEAGKITMGIPEEAKRIGLGELATGHPINAIEKFGQAFYDKPLTTGMDVAGLGEAVEGVAGGLADLGRAALKPTGIPEHIARYAQNASAKNIGASPMQARQLGPEATRAVGQYALDKDLTSPTTTQLGMEKKIDAIHEQAGKQIGDIRNLADTKGSPPSIDGFIRIIKEKLDPKYTEGIESGQGGTYAKALDEVKRAAPTHSGLADIATKLHKAATKATKLKEDSSAIVDVANEVSKLNNEIIKNKVPEHSAAYDAALKDFGVSSKIKQMNLRKQSRDVAGRIGPGGPIREITQRFMDSIGYKAGAAVANKLSKFLKENPEVEKAMPESFKDAVMHVEAPEEYEGLGMSRGGFVKKEMADFVNSRGKRK